MHPHYRYGMGPPMLLAPVGKGDVEESAGLVKTATLSCLVSIIPLYTRTWRGSPQMPCRKRHEHDRCPA